MPRRKAKSDKTERAHVVLSQGKLKFLDRYQLVRGLGSRSDAVGLIIGLTTNPERPDPMQDPEHAKAYKIMKILEENNL
jgi:hypothetical protein